MFKLLKSGKSISVLSHTMQLLAVDSLFTEAVFCLVSTLIMDHDVFAVNRFFNLFSSFPLLGGYINRLYLIED